MNKTILVITLLLSFSTFAKDEACVISYTREACPGQEKTSYEKCCEKKKADAAAYKACVDGAKEKQCTEDKEATSEKDCAKKALKACDNARTDITKSKVITATFAGKPVEGGKNFCAADRPDFNKCK